MAATDFIVAIELGTNHTSPNMMGMPFHWHMTSVNVGRMTFNLSW